jgi:hypothetical protein
MTAKSERSDEEREDLNRWFHMRLVGQSRPVCHSLANPSSRGYASPVPAKNAGQRVGALARTPMKSSHLLRRLFRWRSTCSAEEATCRFGQVKVEHATGPGILSTSARPGLHRKSSSQGGHSAVGARRLLPAIRW